MDGFSADMQFFIGLIVLVGWFVCRARPWCHRVCRISIRSDCSWFRSSFGLPPVILPLIVPFCDQKDHSRGNSFARGPRNLSAAVNFSVEPPLLGSSYAEIPAFAGTSPVTSCHRNGRPACYAVPPPNPTVPRHAAFIGTYIGGRRFHDAR
jgi:hypothetical protein